MIDRQKKLVIKREMRKVWDPGIRTMLEVMIHVLFLFYCYDITNCWILTFRMWILLHRRQENNYSFHCSANLYSNYECIHQNNIWQQLNRLDRQIGLVNRQIRRSVNCQIISSDWSIWCSAFIDGRIWTFWQVPERFPQKKYYVSHDF